MICFCPQTPINIDGDRTQKKPRGAILGILVGGRRQRLEKLYTSDDSREVHFDFVEQGEGVTTIGGCVEKGGGC